MLLWLVMYFQIMIVDGCAWRKKNGSLENEEIHKEKMIFYKKPISKLN